MTRYAVNTAQPILAIRDLHKSFGALEVLRGVNLEVSAGEVVAIIGSSGSGKSTLLRCINRLEHPTSGKVFLAGTEILAKKSALVAMRRQIGMVFQHFNLFPHMSVLENVIEGPVTALGMSRTDARVLGLSLLEKVGLADKAAARPAQLSGGQQQRVAIARALAMRPKVMLFDEVTSALDPEVIGEVTNVIRKLVSEHNLTMLMVTHQMGFARDISDRICFFYGGRIEEQGTPDELFNHPQKERTQQFLRAVKEAV
jgi:polar amino acid transport system ATP-binding protein